MQEPVLPAPSQPTARAPQANDIAPTLGSTPASSYVLGSTTSASAAHNASLQQQFQQQQQQQQQQQLQASQAAAPQQPQGSESLNALQLQYYQMQRAQVNSTLRASHRIGRQPAVSQVSMKLACAAVYALFHHEACTDTVIDQLLRCQERSQPDLQRNASS